MKPSLRKVTLNPQYSFNVRVDAGENLLNKWHYHPEMELILLKRSGGTRIIGNSMENFKHNDIVLIGKNIPHTFIHDTRYLSNHNRSPEAIVVHFHETFFGSEFLNLPELKDIQDLFAKARQGLCVREQNKKAIIGLMEKLLQVSPLERLLLLLEILKQISDKTSHRLLCGKEFVYQTKKEDEGRLNKIFTFTSENYHRNIRIEEVAALVNLTKESFCRFFKAQTRKTYLEFLIEFRIGHACRMLIEDQEKSMKEIGYCCGYDNLSNFYHQFKKTIHKSPLEYQNQYLNLATKYEDVHNFGPIVI